MQDRSIGDAESVRTKLLGLLPYNRTLCSMKRVSVNRELPARGSPAQPPTLGVRHNRKPAPINGKLIAAETRLEKLRDKEIGSSQSALQKALMSNFFAAKRCAQVWYSRAPRKPRTELLPLPWAFLQ
jgi:hypothetical protein